MKPLYMEIDRKNCDLPLAVADSPWELARLRGVDVTSILHAVSKKSKRRCKRSRYILVWVDGD